MEPTILFISAMFLFVHPLLKFIRRKSPRLAFMLLGLGPLYPGRKLLLRNFSSRDPGEAPLVFPAVLLKYLAAALPPAGGIAE